MGGGRGGDEGLEDARGKELIGEGGGQGGRRGVVDGGHAVVDSRAGGGDEGR